MLQTTKSTLPLAVAALLLATAGARAAEKAAPPPDMAQHMAPMAVGAAAKLACSGVFVSGRDLAEVIKDDVERVSPLTREIQYRLDAKAATLTATKAGVSRTALYRPGAGCTLAVDADLAALRRQAADLRPSVAKPRRGLWPAGDDVDLNHVSPDVDASALARAVEAAFTEDTPDGAIDTRAVVVVYDGRIVAERYKPGFGKDTRFLGWSASKSVLGTLVGTLVDDGKLALDAPAPVAEWQGADDPRRAITLDQLMRMSSGLAFDERYLPGSDSTVMLFERGDMAGFAAARPLAHPPGTAWAYSSGTNNILSRIVMQKAGGSMAAAQAYARRRLFAPAGMTSAVFEPDAAGAMVGSSFLYATARDWARFGQLYLDGGMINGRRILSPAWVDYVRRPAPASPNAGYGAQFWLNGFSRSDPKARWMPTLPDDTYFARGFNDQFVMIVPSRKVVIVRLGWTLDSAAFDLDKHFAAILAAIHGPGR